MLLENAHDSESSEAASLTLPIGEELAHHLAGMTRRDPRLATILAQQVLETAGPRSLAGLLLEPEVAVNLLVERLQGDPEGTLRHLEGLAQRHDQSLNGNDNGNGNGHCHENDRSRALAERLARGATGSTSGSDSTSLEMSADPVLAAYCTQMNAAMWAARLAKAKEREITVLEILRLTSEGLSLQAAANVQSPPLSPATASNWVQRYAAQGLLGLMDRHGGIAAGRGTDPPPRARPRGKPKRRPLSFIKWAGSKAQVMRFILGAMPRTYRTYFEPMVGSGTVFFSLRPERAVLGDLNPELMNCYAVIRDRLERLLRALGGHENTCEHFLRVRAQDPAALSSAERAARTIYLNKTCFNGLYRVNASGRFNVPFGRLAHAHIRDEETLRRTHERLLRTTLRCGDFAECLHDARRGDLVYLDPPYLRSASDATAKTFNAYQPKAFGEDEHRRLAEVFRELDRRGCHVLLSNSNVPLVHRLYRGYRIQVIATRRPMNAVASRRQGWEEVLVDTARS